MKITIKCDTAKVEKVLRVLSEGFADFRPFLRDISKIQLDSADESFKTRGNNLGKPWENLKMETVRQKMRLGMNNGPLERTGKMRRGFIVSKLTGNELNIENRMEYFRHHQLGTVKIPQRQVLGHSRELVKMHKVAFVDYSLKLIDK